MRPKIRVVAFRTTRHDINRRKWFAPTVWFNLGETYVDRYSSGILLFVRFHYAG